MTQIVRQTFRARRWYVLHDPVADAYHRVSAPAYRFVALLDGCRSIDEAWRICVERDADEAPTQGEAIRVLGQLAAANLLRGDISSDAEAILRRVSQRSASERKGHAQSFLFLRIPLWDPDRWLKRWTPLAALIWSRFALIPWCLLLLAGLWYLLPRTGQLTQEASSVLGAENLLPLYGSFVIAKLVHEFAHASACKALLFKAGLKGGVHQIGIMLLVMIPMPYVDASAATALPKRSHRIVVAAAGMIAELAVASLAAIVWVYTPADSATHMLAYNLMFVGSVSTIIFNINPLLRYDGYYILSDLLGIANLAQRSREMIHYVIKRHLWGILALTPPVTSRAEISILLSYGVLSSLYRVFVLFGIILFIANQLFVIGIALALAAVSIWLVMPAFKFLVYLFTSPELAARRPRALLTTAALAGAVLVSAGWIRLPHSITFQAIVEPAEWAIIRVQEPGILSDSAPRGEILLEQAVLASLGNPHSIAESTAAQARESQARLRLRRAASQSPAAAAIASGRLDAALAASAHTQRAFDSLIIRSLRTGYWEPTEPTRSLGAYMRRGEVLGTLVIDPRPVLVAVSEQQAAASLRTGILAPATCRTRSRPDVVFGASLQSVAHAADQTTDSPSADVGFILRYQPAPDADVRPGQTVLIRASLPPETIISRIQGWYMTSIRAKLRP
jgi:putative peptide zinc metalloprotease protein